MEHLIGTPLQLSLTIQKKTGYKFEGWYDGETKITEINKGYKENITLNAKWSIIDYIITYQLDGGINAPANPSTYNIESETITLANPSKNGYAFIGWFYEETKITSIDPKLNSNLTITAKWSIDTDSTCFEFADNYVITGLKDSSVINIEIPDYVTAISDNAFNGTFYENLKLETVRFSAGSKCTQIGEYAFHYCETLTTVELPASLESLGMCAFYMCTSLEKVVFAENIKLNKICGGVFNDCYNLSSITIPASVTEIEDAAISGCTSLTQIIFEKNSKLQKIGSFNFAMCENLNSIVIPLSVTEIGNLSYCNISDVYYAGNANDWNNITGNKTFPANSTIYYYSETKPAESGNYWHYVEDIITKW